MALDSSQTNELVTAHLDVASKAAAMIYPRVRDHVEFAELEALGRVGLVEAAQRFKPGMGASFATFAWYRVHGAIMDGLRRATAIPRRKWAQLEALRSAAEYLEQRGNAERSAARQTATAPPTVASTAEALGKIRDAMAAIKTVYITSLDAAREHGFDPASPEANAEVTVATQQQHEKLRVAIATLPEKEQALLRKHYYEGKTLDAAGAELGVSKSWASRIHAQAIDRLRPRMSVK